MVIHGDNKSSSSSIWCTGSLLICFATPLTARPTCISTYSCTYSNQQWGHICVNNTCSTNIITHSVNITCNSVVEDKCWCCCYSCRGEVLLPSLLPPLTPHSASSTFDFTLLYLPISKQQYDVMCKQQSMQGFVSLFVYIQRNSPHIIMSLLLHMCL